jgi:fatty-acyl-CoA synthase
MSRAPWEEYPATIVEAIDQGRGILDVGYTFVGPDGKEEFFSWDRLRAESIKRAHHLRKLGLKKGDRLAMVLPDGQDFVPTFFGALWAGIIPVPLYPPLSLGKLDTYVESLVTIMRKAEPALVVTHKRVEQVIWSAVGQVPSLKGLVTAEALAVDAPEASQSPEQISPEDTAFLQFTSGSTSAPKGVVVSHANLRVNCGAIMVQGLKAGPGDRGVSWLPLYHDMGLIGFVLAPLFHKVPVTFLPTLSFVKNATLWLETLHRVKGTITFAPNFAYALVTKRAKSEQIARWDLSHVRAFGCGAEPINPETMEAFLKTFEPTGLKRTSVLPSYGMAEATLAITFIDMSEELSCDHVAAEGYHGQDEARAVSPEHKGINVVCCGRPFAEHEVVAMDGNGRTLPERRIGEIVLRGPSVTRGYYLDPVATAGSFRDGWLHTGDLGYLANGQVYIVGRKKDLIIINGRNYDPQRIEWLAEEVPGVRKGSVVAFSRPGASSEELVVVAEGRESEREAILQTLRTRINEQMQLTVADILLLRTGTLPKTSSGKLQRQKTRAYYLEGKLGVEGVRTLGGNAQRLMLAKHYTLSLVGRGRHVARGLVRGTFNYLLEPKTPNAGILGKGREAAQWVADRTLFRYVSNGRKGQERRGE